MSQASFDLSPVPGGPATAALPIVVCRYDSGADSPYTVLCNVRCLRVDYREGPEPPLARFQYFTDDLLEASLGWPARFEKLWPIDAKGSYVVLNDDRLVVLTQDPEDNLVVLFDGFAQIPQVDLSAQSQTVTFVCQGAAIRLWDAPIFARYQRDASNVSTTDGSADVLVQLPCRFNPSDTSIGSLGGYIGNCVPTASYTEVDEDSEDTYPVFLDPLVSERGDNETSYWYVSDAITYLIATEQNPTDDAGNPYVQLPTLGSLKDLLTCQSPPDNGTLNSGDAQETDIQIRDYDASNKALPDVFAELLGYCGFVMVFTTTTDNEGMPQNQLKLLRKDALSTAAPKLLYLAVDGTTSLSLSANNVTTLHLARDCNQVVNKWSVETALKQVEITVELAPGFTPNAADAANPAAFFSQNYTGPKYRRWIADECADGHYNMATSTWVTDKPLDLSAIFPPDDAGDSTYVDRYRPGSRTLIAHENSEYGGEPLKAVLEILKGYYSVDPKLEDNPDQSGWVNIPYGKGWKLLDDRLGIEITAAHPDEWTTGSLKDGSGSIATIPKVNALTWTATPTDDTAFVLRLTTVIESDQRITARGA